MPGQYTIGPPDAAASTPASSKYTVGPADEPKKAAAAPPTAVAPIANFLDYPLRAIPADIAGTVYGALSPSDFVNRFDTARGKVMQATEMPETPFGQGVSRVLGLPGELLSSAIHAGSENLLGPEITRGLGPAATVAGDILPVAGAARALSRPRLTPDQVLQNQARSAISTPFATGAKAGGPTALDAVQSMGAARGEGQPLALIDIPNTELKSAIGTIYRQGGAARQIIKDFLEGRNIAQGERIRGLIGKYISDGSMRDTAAELLQERSAKGRKLFDTAAEGGSTAPLEHQFAQAFQAAVQKEAAAQKAVTQAQQAVTLAHGKQAVAGNVYSSSAANAGVRAAEKVAQDAQATLDAAQKEKAAIRERLVRAQADRTANAPGAVWSPYLQRLLDQPEIQAGIRRGYAIERRKAAGGDRPFNPHEYAVIGETEAGEPIVGTVPNMRLLMVAKEGLDAIIAEKIDPATGRLTKEGHSYKVMRDGEAQADGSVRGGLVPELDRLNPAYKAARDAWSGDTASFMALDQGSHLFDPKWFRTTEDVAEFFNKLGTNDREFVKMGVAAKLKELLEAAPDAADRAKRIINNERVRDRMRAVLGNDAAPFIDAIERERTMRETPQRLYGGSATAERVAADSSLERFARGADIAMSAIRHPLSAAARALKLKKDLSALPNPRLNEAVARLVTQPTPLLPGATDTSLLPPVGKQPFRLPYLAAPMLLPARDPSVP